MACHTDHLDSRGLIIVLSISDTIIVQRALPCRKHPPLASLITGQLARNSSGGPRCSPFAPACILGSDSGLQT